MKRYDIQDGIGIHFLRSAGIRVAIVTGRVSESVKMRAQELGQPVGEAVGFKVRFTDQTKPDAYVKLMTDGILLAETQGDRDLLAYDTIIVDEAHERSLNIDFLLGYLKRLLDRRADLKVIVTSATLDADRFAAHFAAPVIEVSGRTYPVEIRYRPPVGGDVASDSDREADDEEEARRFMEADPVIVGGYATGELRPFRVSLMRGRDG